MRVGSLEIELMANVARLQRDMNMANRVVGNATASMSRAADTVKAALGGIAAGIGLSQLVQMSDAYAKFTAQLRLASSSVREYAASYADVKRIATAAQQDLQATGMLYARIANGTRELGTTQKQVAAITETVNMALKVSGATATESASAQLQLSQAFASGTLRGEEFNAVNEAAPRLMLALADGIGVPVGALKKMAENGEITSKIMADVLPNALAKLREEAKEVQTIAGAFVVLKNNMMEFVGIQANASGGVKIITTAIGALADNLQLLAGAVVALAIVFGSKLVSSIVAATAAKMQDVAASIAQARAAELAAGAALRRAQAEQQAAFIGQTRARDATIMARMDVAAIQSRTAAVVLAAELEVTTRQAQFAATATIIRSEITLERARHAAQINDIGRAQRVSAMARMATELSAIERGLAVQSTQLAAVRIANESAVANAASVGAARIAAARHAETAATGAAAAATMQMRTATAGAAAATAAASGASIAARGALAALGGPIGLITLALTLGATAWMVWGNKGSEAEKKVVDTLADEIDGFLANLDKQIEKLKERNELAEKKMIPAAASTSDGEMTREKIMGELNRIGKQTDIDIGIRTELMKVWGARLNQLTLDTEQFTAAQQKNKDLVFDEKEAEWLGKFGTAAQKTAYELAELQKEYGRVTPAMKAFVEAKYADKGAATAIKQEASSYASLITSIKEKIAAGQLELSGNDKLTDAQKMTIKLDAEIATGKNRLSASHISEARALISKVAALDSAIASAKAADDIEKSFTDDAQKVWDEVRALEAKIATYGLVGAAVVEAERTKIQAQLLSAELSAKETADLEMKLAGLDRLLVRQKEFDALGKGGTLQQAKDLLEIMVQVDEATKSAAQSMADSFGKVGSAIGSLTTALSGYGRTQQAIAAQLAAVKDDKRNDPQAIMKAEIAAAKAGAQARIKSYGDMAGAAKGFFKENSTGYKAMEGAEKAYRAVEMAMAIQNMVMKSGLVAAFTTLFTTSKVAEVAADTTATGTSVLNSGIRATADGAAAVAKTAASVPYPANIAAVASVIALLAGVGVALSGGGGGSTLAQDRQAAAGTGSVLGNKSAKSESIAKAIELAAANSNIELTHTAGMLRALLSIESSIGNLGGLLARSGAVTGDIQADTKGTAARFTEGIGSKLTFTALLDTIAKGWIGKVSGKVSNAVFGGNVTALDTGVMLQKGRLGNILANGVQADRFTDTKKKGGLFHSDKYDTQKTTLGVEANDQFTKVFADMAKGITAAGDLLGLGGMVFTARLNSFVVDLDKISTKGLTADQIQKQLETVFAKAADDMARWSVEGLLRFQGVGEGAFETLVRIASNYANIDSILESVGMKFGAVGMVSVTARENLIDLAGGIDKLAGQAASFSTNYLTEAERLAPVTKYVTAEMAALGLASITTREQFKGVVLGLNLSTAAGQQQYVALMALESAFAKVYAATVDLSKSQQAIADERLDLQRELDELTMTSAQLLSKQRMALDASNRGLFDQIQSIKTMREAQEAAKSSLGDVISRMKSFGDSARALRDNLLMGSLTTLTPEQQYAEARRQRDSTRAAALAGDAAAQSNLSAMQSAFLTISQKVNGGDSQYSADFAGVLKMSDEIAIWSGGQVDVAQASLDALNAQVVGIANLNATMLAVSDQLAGTPNYGSLGTSNMAPLVAEIKTLRSSNEALIEEVKGLRADQQKQTGDLMGHSEKVADRQADKIVGGAMGAASEGSWRADHPERVVAK